MTAAPQHQLSPTVWARFALRAFQTVAAGLRDRGITLGAREDEITVELMVDPAISA